MTAASTDRPIRGVNVVILSDGREVHIDDITTVAEGQTIIDDLDGAILGIPKIRSSRPSPLPTKLSVRTWLPSTAWLKTTRRCAGPMPLPTRRLSRSSG